MRSVARGEAALRAMAEAGAGSGKGTVLELDLSDLRSVERFAQAFLRLQLPLHLLINNAGILRDGLMVKVKDGEVERRMELSQGQAVIDVNLAGVFLCGREAATQMIKNGDQGAIINIASTRAWQSEAHSEAYAAAKGGLVAFTHALAISAGPAVRVNSISPGWISTTAWQAPARRHEPDYSAIDHAQHPVGRVGQPEDIGALAVYLLSSLSGFSTGQDFIVDGGMTRKMIYAE